MIVSYSDVMEKLKEKHDKQKLQIVGSFPLLRDVQDNVMLGSFSWYYMRAKKRQIMRQYALPFPETISTPSELARTYLSLKYPRLRATKEQLENFKIHRSAPLYASPHRYESGVYIDIRGAFWAILQVVGWDVDYNPGVWLGRGEPMDDFPFAEIKLSRNCLVTAGLPSEASFWDGDERKFKVLKTFNKVVNLGIWACVMDILHCIAWDCIAAGAIYAHTDGFICASSRLDAVRSAISEWGLESRIKLQGETEVWGVGCYSIGKHKTKNVFVEPFPFDGLLLPRYNKWLKARFQRFAEKTTFQWKNLNWTSCPSEHSTLSLPAGSYSTLSPSAGERYETPAIKTDSDGVILETQS